MRRHSLNALNAALRACIAGVHFAALTGDPGADGKTWVQILPAGKFRARDGRPEKVEAWLCDAQIAATLIETFRGQATDMVIDYEHQTLNAEENGEPAPAAGWIRELEWREGQGVFGAVEWTERARAHIATKEYRYFSPVFASDPKTGAVTRLLMGAITNFPGLDGMLPIAARHEPTEDNPMNKLLAAIVAALALAADTTEDQGIAAVNALKGLDPAKLRKSLGLKDDADGAAIVASAEKIAGDIATRDTEISALKATTDRAKFVPVEVVEQLKTEIATLRAGTGAEEVDKLVKEGLGDGRLHTAQESWARDLGKSDLAALKSYLAATKPIDALRSTQTGGKQPDKEETGAHGLTPSEVEVCRITGVSHEAFAKQKKARA